MNIRDNVSYTQMQNLMTMSPSNLSGSSVEESRKATDDHMIEEPKYVNDIPTYEPIEVLSSESKQLPWVPDTRYANYDVPRKI